MTLLGLGFTYGPVLDPIGVLIPFTYEIDIDKDSILTVYINDVKVREIFVTGGYYELKNFPLRTGFNVIRITKDTAYSNIKDGEYNDIEIGGAVYTTKLNKGETYLEQRERLHHARKLSSDLLLQSKLLEPELNQEDSFSATHNVYRTETIELFSVDPVLFDPQYFEIHYSMGYPMSWNG